MGANMTPTMKKSGRTVFGVKMGLRSCQPSQLVARAAGAPTATPLVAAAGMQYLVGHQHAGLSRATPSLRAAYSVASCSSPSSARPGLGPGSISSRCARLGLFAT